VMPAAPMNSTKANGVTAKNPAYGYMPACDTWHMMGTITVAAKKPTPIQ
jgi:hypothetical protein